MNTFFLRSQKPVSPGILRAWGLALAIASVILPALKLGPLFAQPPIPFAALWAAYGWAAEHKNDWRAPISLMLIGLLHDQLAGGPFGVFATIYLAAYLIGRVASELMSAQNLLSLWGGFIVTALLTVAIAAVLARWAYGEHTQVGLYLQGALITAVLFPLVRPLYMTNAPAARAQGGVRR